MKGSRLLLTVVSGVLALGSLCKTTPPPGRQWEPGFFEPIPGRPWSWPGGVNATDIIGADDEIPASELPLAARINNYNQRRTAIVMPAGLVFSPMNPEYQHMMILQEFRFSVPVGETVVMLPTYCANEDLDEPDDESRYLAVLQVWELELNELFELLRPKRLENEAVNVAQDALWEITEGGALSDTMRAKLRALPDR